MKTVSSNLMSVLHAEKPAADRADKLQLYGRFIGDWETKVIAHAPDGARHEASGEIHFGWILEGRAIQDVWMIPRLAERPNAPPFPVGGNWFGTTIRSTTPLSMSGASIGSIRLEISFGSKSGGSAETTSCRKAKPSQARCRDGALPTSRRIHFTGWVSHPQAETAHGN
jgi:hypothetical protein